ncbi:cytochrome P450 [Sphaerisporangium krabiense]|uniref:Cytochrome P450 n=1 Tax=Sphaerisporangium krabiense TaxID=763782 RepID=A0A7W8ZDB1_9ACTN|nr:cytochrome P450 [Sphaerisporangium krabiense]MBB5631618.1 cytochrome P450 [Sphaerisporangium krabiense]GII61032.1 cytochrome P450 [Sphaerisporangium krabiense]
MTAAGQAASAVPEIELTAEVLRDPFAVYGRARERAPLGRLLIPGLGPVWAVLRYGPAKAMLGDPRFQPSSASFMRPGVPGDCLPYMTTMTERPAPEHARLRRLVSPAFTPRRAAEFRPRVQAVVDALLDALPAHAGEDGVVDLLRHFAWPLPMEVICELVGIPEAGRPVWRECGAFIAAGAGRGFAESLPGVIAGARAAVARRRREPADDLLSDLVRAQADDGDRLTDTELVTMVWHLVLAGQTPANLIANAVAALLSHPGQRAALRDEPGLMPRAVEELTRWCGPTLLSIPRYAREDAELGGVTVREGEGVVAVVAAANRDPRAFADPDRLDVTRAPGPAAHLGFAHGPHFCVGAALARVQAEVALTTLLGRHPGLSLAAGDPVPAPDPGVWRPSALPVRL